uniref:Ankyrin repeat domain 13B n=1 Tax=Eptatretus burgeri TaxID=7764 RepID=A0A8C4NL10_EPTBU
MNKSSWSLKQHVIVILEELERRDPHGRTALHLAVALGHLESARVLLRHDADVGAENTQGWTVLQEAVSTGDPELVQLVLQFRDYQRAVQRLEGIPRLLDTLRKAQDFFVEMKWEFTSWVPLVSRVCPSDVYRVWKAGANLRVDTTLLGFERMAWIRGSHSFIFKGQEDGGALLMEVDHDRRVVYVETLEPAGDEHEELLAACRPSAEHVAHRLTSPLVSTHIDTQNIQFERNMSGIWGWRSEKRETVNGYETKVYSACNVELVTRTRTEHLSEQDKVRSKGNKTPLQSFLGIAEQHVGMSGSATEIKETASPTNPTAITPDEYFDPKYDLGERDVGRPVTLTVKTQRLKARLCLCEGHPLSLAERVAPIIDLMAFSSAHFAKLRDFIMMRLPAGFPVKIEIPLFHVLNARITFGNLNGCDSPVDSVHLASNNPDLAELATTPSNENCSSPKAGTLSQQLCKVDPELFEIPEGYTVLSRGAAEPAGCGRGEARDADDELLQFAIEQSLLQAGTELEQVTVWEALANSRPGEVISPNQEDRDLESALQESLLLQASTIGVTDCLSEFPPRGELREPPVGGIDSMDERESVPGNGPTGEPPNFTDQLRLAMELSAREVEEAEQRQREEDEELERVLQLSLIDK